MKQIVVSIHDVHGESLGAAMEQVAFCEALGLDRFSILLVPEFHGRERFDENRDLLQWLTSRQALGDDIVLHGFYHRDDSPSRSIGQVVKKAIHSSSEGEFLALDVETARQRLRDGRVRMLRQGLTPAGFIAPAWLMGAEIAPAIFKEGFLYTNTIDVVYTADGRAIPSRSLCYSTRSAVRLGAALAWNAGLWRAVRGQDVVRLSLHPNDLKHVAVRKQVEAILREAVQRGFVSTTYQELAAAPELLGPPPAVHVRDVVRDLVRDPVGNLLLRWNWKAAVLSSIVRSLVVLAGSASSGLNVAVDAMSVEFIYRGATAGFCGAIIESFRSAEPYWAGQLTMLLVVPLISDSFEILAQWFHGNPHSGRSAAISLSFTAVSTAFNYYAMRRGAFIIGKGRGRLIDDIRSAPRLIVDFLTRPLGSG